jgi:hypothetical protein
MTPIDKFGSTSLTIARNRAVMGEAEAFAGQHHHLLPSFTQLNYFPAQKARFRKTAQESGRAP